MSSYYVCKINFNRNKPEDGNNFSNSNILVLNKKRIYDFKVSKLDTIFDIYFFFTSKLTYQLSNDRNNNNIDICHNNNKFFKRKVARGNLYKN